MTRTSDPFFLRLFRWRYFSLVNLFLILLIVFSFSREMIRRHDIDAQIATLKKQAQSLQTQNGSLNELYQAVQTETYIEREARLKLGLKKPGESVVILSDSAGSQSTPKGADPLDPLGLVAEGSGIQKPLANSQKWWYYFFNK